MDWTYDIDMTEEMEWSEVTGYPPDAPFFDLPIPIIERYTRGLCHTLALALQAALRDAGRWTTLHAVLEPWDTHTPSGVTGLPHHIFLLDGAGHAIDVTGRRPLPDLMDRYGYWPVGEIAASVIDEWIDMEVLKPWTPEEWDRAMETARLIADALDDD